MAWCRQATSHYLSQCWQRFMSPYGVTMPQYVSDKMLKIRAEWCQSVLKSRIKMLLRVHFRLNHFQSIAHVPSWLRSTTRHWVTGHSVDHKHCQVGDPYHSTDLWFGLETQEHAQQNMRMLMFVKKNITTAWIAVCATSLSIRTRTLTPLCLHSRQTRFLLNFKDIQWFIAYYLNEQNDVIQTGSKCHEISRDFER